MQILVTKEKLGDRFYFDRAVCMSRRHPLTDSGVEISGIETSTIKVVR